MSVLILVMFAVFCGVLYLVNQLDQARGSLVQAGLRPLPNSTLKHLRAMREGKEIKSLVWGPNYQAGDFEGKGQLVVIGWYDVAGAHHAGNPYYHEAENGFGDRGWYDDVGIVAVGLHLGYAPPYPPGDPRNAEKWSHVCTSACGASGRPEAPSPTAPPESATARDNAGGLPGISSEQMAEMEALVRKWDEQDRRKGN